MVERSEKGCDGVAEPGVCVCVRACVRACVRVCVCVCARVCFGGVARAAAHHDVEALVGWAPRRHPAVDSGCRIPVVQPAQLRVACRERSRASADVDPDAAGGGQPAEEREADGAGAAADVEEGGRVAVRLRHQLYQPLRLRPRDEHRRPHLEREVHEVPIAEDVLDGLAREPARAHALKGGARLGVELLLPVDR